MTQLLTSSADHLLADLVEELSEKLAEGSSADVEAFLAIHADHAEKLRPLIPTLQVLVEMGSSPGRNGRSRTSQAEDHEHPTGGHPVLGDFRILREVGRGGMGVVYEAEQISLRRRVALKVLPTAAMLDPRALQRFRNEAQAAAALHHSQIVPIFGVGCERGVHYYAMQFIDGLTLAEVIANLRDSAGIKSPELEAEPTASVPLSPWERAGVRVSHQPEAPARAEEPAPKSASETEVMAALSTEKSGKNTPAWFRRIAEQFAQVADALHHAHELGVTHRDIKPANLMLDRLGHIWITDFGLARIEGEGNLTMTGDLVGTLRYMSPEQSLAKRIGIDHRTDIYSLGITLYELLTLHPALPGHGRQEILRQIAFEEPKAPRKHNPAIPRDLETIVLKMIEKIPAERYQSGADLAADLKRFVDDRHIAARRPSFYSRSLKWSRRHVTVLLATLGVVTLFAASMSVGLFLIVQARNDAVTKSDDLQKERDKANEILRDMDRTIQGMFEGVAHLPIDDPVRKVLVEQQLKFFEKLKSSDDKSPVIRELAARTHHRLGHLQIDLKELAASAENFRQCIALLEPLAAEDRQSVDYESELAEASMNFGRVRALQGRDADAEKLFKASIEHAERALLLDPHNLWATTNLAYPHGQLSQADAVRFARKEIELQEAVLARAPSNRDVRLVLAAAHRSLASAIARGGNFRTAVDEVSLAIGIQTILNRERPTDYLGRLRMMQYHTLRGWWCLELQNPPFDPLDEIEQARLTNVRDREMLELTAWILCRYPGHSRNIYEKAHQVASDLVDANPQDGPLLNTLAVSCYRLERYDEALKKLTRSLELQGANAIDLLFLAMTHQQLGHPDDAKIFLDRGRTQFGKSMSTLPISTKQEIERFVHEAEQTLATVE